MCFFCVRRFCLLPPPPFPAVRNVFIIPFIALIPKTPFPSCGHPPGRTLNFHATSPIQAIRNAGGFSYSSSTTGRTTSNHHSRREEDTASTPLDVLQLGVSLGLPELSAAAARAVLLQLDNVSKSEAFEASGMSKRELVVAALEAVRS